MNGVAVRRGAIAGVLAWAVWLGACQTVPQTPRTDPDIARAAHLARLSFERGSIEQAERLYERALQMARAADDMWECGTLAYNLAVCRAEQERLDEALKALAEARGDYERISRSMDEIHLLKAEIARRQGRFDDAMALTKALRETRGKKRGEGHGFSEVEALAALIQVRTACDQGKIADGTRLLNDIKRATRKRKLSVELQAQMARDEGRLAAAGGKPLDAAQAFDRESEIWREAKQYRRMAVAMGRAAEAYKAGAALKPALERYYLAARAFAAQGDDVEALRLIQSALEGSEESADGAQMRLIANLFEEIKARTPKK